MSRKILLRVAAFFVLFTCVAHSVGALHGPPPQPEVQSVYAVMKQTMVMFPVGSPKSIASLMLGVNICLSVYLFVAGMLLILLSGEAPLTLRDRKVLVLNSTGLVALAATCFVFIFPIPAICTGLAAIFGFVALKSK